MIQVGSFLNFDTICLTETLLKITLYFISGFHCTQKSEFLLLLIPSFVNYISSTNRMSRRICSHSWKHAQNCTWTVWPSSKRFYTLWRWYTQKASPHKIIHTCVTAVQSTWKLCILLQVHFTALQPEIHLFSKPWSVYLVFTCGKNHSHSQTCVHFEMCKIWSSASVLMKTHVSWDMMFCHLKNNYWHFR